MKLAELIDKVREGKHRTSSTGSAMDYVMVAASAEGLLHKAQVANRLERQVESYQKCRMGDNYIPPSEDDVSTINIVPGVVINTEKDGLSEIFGDEKTPDAGNGPTVPTPPKPLPPTPPAPVVIPTWLKWVAGGTAGLAALASAAALWAALQPPPNYQGTLTYDAKAVTKAMADVEPLLETP